MRVYSRRLKNLIYWKEGRRKKKEEATAISLLPFCFLLLPRFLLIFKRPQTADHRPQKRSLFRRCLCALRTPHFALLLLSCAPASAQTLDELVAATRQKYQQVISTGQVPAELQPLHIQLSDREPAVRIKAVQGLALVGGPMSALLLLPAMDESQERIPAVRIEAARGLGDVGGRQALEVLGIGLLDRDATVRMRVVASLRWAGTVFAVPYISIALNGDPSANRPADREVGVRLEAVRMLRKIGTQFSIQPLVDALFTDRDAMIRKAAADALGEVGKKERDAARYLGEAYLQEKDMGVKLEIIGSLGLIRDRAGLPYLQAAMQDRDATLRMRATQVYGRVLGLQ